MAQKIITLPEGMFLQNNSSLKPRSVGLKELQSKKPRRKERAADPLRRVNLDILSSSVVSIEGYNFAVVISNDCSGFR